MAWIILEGLDRTGKTTVAERYKQKGFEVVHMSAPDKKFMQPGYVGPSYFEELVDIYMNYDGRDIVFDRSPYGELVWPKVYGRQAQLMSDDFEFLREYEDNNETVRILMYDDDKDAHWKRCVENDEPLNKGQFSAANEFFKSMAERYGFIKKTLPEIQKDFKDEQSNSKPTPEEVREEQRMDKTSEQYNEDTKKVSVDAKPSEIRDLHNKTTGDLSDPEYKLDVANAIKKILSRPTVRQGCGYL